MQIISEIIFSLQLNICRVTIATIIETSVDLRVTCPLLCPILSRTLTDGQISLLFPILNSMNSRTVDPRDISYVQRDKRINQFNMSLAVWRTRMTVEHILIPDTFFL